MMTNNELLEMIKKDNEVKLFGIRVKNKDIEEFRDLQEMTGLKASQLFSLMLEAFGDKYTFLDIEELEEGDK